MQAFKDVCKPGFCLIETAGTFGMLRMCSGGHIKMASM